jgi:hypothetical protein
MKPLGLQKLVTQMYAIPSHRVKLSNSESYLKTRLDGFYFVTYLANTTTIIDQNI